MSRYSDDLVSTYGTVGKLKRVTEQLKKQRDKKMCQNEIDRTITEVLKGKFKRRGY